MTPRPPRPHRIAPALPVALAMTLAMTLVATPSAAGQAVGLGSSHAQFCAEAQRRLTGTALPIANVVEGDAEAFKTSKPAVQPLRTHQHLAYDPAGRPLQLSCKTKSADHLRSAYGATAAGTDRSCRDLHRGMVIELWRDLAPAQRAGAPYPPWQVMLETDSRSYTGSSWIKAGPEALRGADGRLHLRAAGLFAEWEDWRWKIMPQSFRGNHYCHLVAPERIRRLMLGQEHLGRDPALQDP